MNPLYKAAGLSKQAFHQYLDNKMKQRSECEQLLPIILQVRREYPSLSAREMYRIIKPVRIGRDRFERFCFEEGFKIERKPAFHRTTNSLGVTRFPNLIKDIELKGINHVWVSDITYYRIKDRFYYLTFITDQYSRKILGHSVSSDLLTENTTIPALTMALNQRGGIKPAIFHSDGGGQYYSKEFRFLTMPEIASSMGECAYDNPHAERINGLIKNDYLAYYDPKNLEDLKKETERAIYNYNLKRHSALNMSPYELDQLSTYSQKSTKEKKNQKKKNSQQLNRFVHPYNSVNLIQA
jgi:putative transposase